ncbi:hypothetical protein [Streptomyces sp. NPDC002994]|uniref:hypothetical protein n=1 Tax=Streptomyces sp. NPDC002994 TaxID=3154441 RepID=UPI0033AB1153
MGDTPTGSSWRGLIFLSIPVLWLVAVVLLAAFDAWPTRTPSTPSPTPSASSWECAIDPATRETADCWQPTP